jgi:AcrR family transcriptional regulator
MPIGDDTPKRGRPQTLDRDAVTKIALACYWQDGPTRVSISQICQAANVSKPSLYREFGSDDGLRDAALDLYRQVALVPYYENMNRGIGFKHEIEALIAFMTQDRTVLGIPSGCLQVEMRSSFGDLGDVTRAKVDLMRGETLETYEKWIDRAKSTGECTADISSKAAAFFCDVQNMGAMRMQREGVPNEIIGQTLKFAFSTLAR